MTMTSNPPAAVDSDAFTVRRTITIKAQVATVWAAISEPEHLSRWFPEVATFDTVAVGETGSFTFEGYGSFPVQVEELDEPNVIAYRWGGPTDDPTKPIDPKRSTVFRFTLDAIEEGTQLTVVETGFNFGDDPAANMDDHRGGWDSELDELVAYLEGA
ncbi:SRPBCC family protein [Salinibacterium sp. NSLL150]|uniref:SRPBCC family protein n=1 Tax=unclassified Salinibacterium TaxID=2632331 RepID=UPI0018CF6724|nr:MULTISPECIES: SRPBCC family protein [unclassified Salinibacterium]MBH0097825.1 SRPBCC family protein [Salinibacterium sp. NSLL35]MBH0100580.1 SRPBCC family protein [Salinibacterium sp. NSLL150]MBH0103339.1 SRPBCC family protein [Salinibacterium sp. NSLL16]MBH0106100.1 SRPBCC family protein [Salinibacterium sp. NSLL17]